MCIRCRKNSGTESGYFCKPCRKLHDVQKYEIGSKFVVVAGTSLDGDIVEILSIKHLAAFGPAVSVKNQASEEYQIHTDWLFDVRESIREIVQSSWMTLKLV